MQLFCLTAKTGRSIFDVMHHICAATAEDTTIQQSWFVAIMLLVLLAITRGPVGV